MTEDKMREKQPAPGEPEYESLYVRQPNDDIVSPDPIRAAAEEMAKKALKWQYVEDAANEIEPILRAQVEREQKRCISIIDKLVIKQLAKVLTDRIRQGGE
ncbi:MAG: hypothetical protein ACYTEQ_25370 [Planctomycetota bacterium]